MKHTQVAWFLWVATVCLTGLATSAPTQSKKAEKPGVTDGEGRLQAVSEEQKPVKKIFEIKYADANKLTEILRVFTGGIVPNSDLRVIAVSGTREAVAA